MAIASGGEGLSDGGIILHAKSRECILVARVPLRRCKIVSLTTYNTEPREPAISIVG